MAHKFNVGDVVMVEKKVEKEEGWINTWEDEMDWCISHGFHVTKVDAAAGVYFDETFYGFPPSSLKLVRAAEVT